jgi:hypothetical protein
MMSNLFKAPSSTRPKKPPDRTDEEIQQAMADERRRAGLASGRASTVLGGEQGLMGNINIPKAIANLLS